MRDCRAEQAKLAHLAHDLAVELLLEIGVRYARLQLVLGIAFGSIANEPLLIVELMLEIEWIRPVERKDGRLAHCLMSPRCDESRGALSRAVRTSPPPQDYFDPELALAPPRLCLKVSPKVRCRLRSRNSSSTMTGSARLGKNSSRSRPPLVLRRIVDIERIDGARSRPVFEEGRAVRAAVEIRVELVCPVKREALVVADPKP